MPAAFTPSTPVPLGRASAAVVNTSRSSPPRRTRHRVPRAVVSTPPPANAPPSSLKERSIVTLRGLSDLASLALVHEVALRLTTTSTTASTASSFSADAQLLLGGLIGLWTAAAWATRQRRVVATAIADATALPDRWDAAVLYTPTFEDDEIPAAVAWLNAFDELDGVAAAELLPMLAASPRPAARALLANALACFPSRSNVAVTTLTHLATDQDARVRAAAAECAAAYAAEGILQIAGSSPANTQERSQTMQIAHVGDGDIRACRAVLERVLDNPEPIRFPMPDALMPGRVQRAAWIADVVDSHVDALLTAALSQPDLRGLSLQSGEPVKTEKSREQEMLREAAGGEFWSTSSRQKRNNTDDVKQVGDTVDVQARVPTPLFDTLRWSELHGVCALALVPALYELAAVTDGADLPLRFVGLGWLLAVGGMAAYPQSARLWSEFRQTMDAETWNKGK